MKKTHQLTKNKTILSSLVFICLKSTFAGKFASAFWQRLCGLWCMNHISVMNCSDACVHFWLGLISVVFAVQMAGSRNWLEWLWTHLVGSRLLPALSCVEGEQAVWLSRGCGNRVLCHAEVEQAFQLSCGCGNRALCQISQFFWTQITLDSTAQHMTPHNTRQYNTT